MDTARLLSISGFLVFLLGAGVAAQTPFSPQLQRLHDVLNLRVDQDGGWQTYVRSTAADPEEAARRRDASQRMANLSAPDRVDLSIQMMKADLASLERRGAALKIFYASLTPEQKATFDRETIRPPQ
ncbi:MAG TPA: Spy/CpxP family protein refolding chaperone [Rhizomicrobium sp.]|nr:Spy/CpxP family protein refolding chaperone [Rhizomicrobium sp.]